MLNDVNVYMKLSDHVYKYSQTMQLNDHLGEYIELYFTPYGDKSRKALINNNPEQSVDS